MDWGETLLRTLMQVGLVVAWLWLFLSAKGMAQGGPILFIPFFFGIPALLLSILVLAPAEAALRGRFGLAAYPLLIAAGAGVPMLIFVLRDGIKRAFAVGARMVYAIFAGWALLWVATKPVYSWLAG